MLAGSRDYFPKWNAQPPEGLASRTAMPHSPGNGGPEERHVIAGRRTGAWIQLPTSQRAVMSGLPMFGAKIAVG
jgi:hypothetical protein